MAASAAQGTLSGLPRRLVQDGLLTEEQMLGAVMFGHKSFQPVIDAILSLAEKAAKEPWDFEPEDRGPEKAAIKKLVGKDLEAAYAIADKMVRQAAVSAARQKAMDELGESETRLDGIPALVLKDVFKSLEAEIVRGGIDFNNLTGFVNEPRTFGME